MLKKFKYWPYLIAVLIVFVARLPTLTNYILFIDEPIYFSQAMRLPTFESFLYATEYRIETKSQYGLLPYLLALAINFEQAILVLRILGMLSYMLAACLCIAIAKRAFQTVWPAFISMFIWLIYLDYNDFTIGVLLEAFLLPLLLLSFWLFGGWLENPNGRLILLWVGLVLGVAFLVKPPAILPLGVYGFGIVAIKGLPSQRVEVVEVLKLYLALALGFFIPLAVLGLPYVLRPDTWPEFAFNFFSLPALYTIENRQALSFLQRVFITLRFMGMLSLFFLATSILSFSVFVWWSRKSQSRLININQWLLLGVGLSLLIGFGTGQAKPHYVIPILPFLMLFVGYRLYLGIVTISKDVRINLFMGLVLVGLICVGEFQALAYYWGLYSDKGAIYKSSLPDLDEALLVDYITVNTKPTDKIWVYYASPEIYWKSQRPPATNDPAAVFFVLFYDWRWVERNYRELERDKPVLIIGLANTHYKVEEVMAVNELPLIKDFIERDYTCSREQVPNTIICKRK